MRNFLFTISGSRPFSHDVLFPSDAVAWDEVVRLVRDIEGQLKPGEEWSLTISDKHGPVFRIQVQTADLRPKESAPAGRSGLRCRLLGTKPACHSP